MIKYKKPTLDTLKRFPCLYRMQAQQLLDKEVRLAISSTADSFFMASLLVLIEEFEMEEDDIRRFVAHFQTTIDTNCEYYEEAVAEGLRHKLKEYGYEYD